MWTSRCLIALTASLVLAACGGSSPASSAPSRPTTRAGSTPSPTTEAAPPPASTQTSAPTQGPARCTASRLTLSFLGQQGATGHGELGFALRNVSAASCRTFGYPGILFLDRSGHPLPTDAVRTARDLFGAAPVHALVLAPGASASFRLGVTHGIASSAGCTTAYGLQVIAPDDTASLRTTIPDGAYECTGATVTPLLTGESAYP